MNKVRRNTLSDILGKIEGLKSVLEEVLEEEEDCMNNFPESLQGSARYEIMENAVSSMEEVIGNLEDACYSLEEIVIA